MLAHLKNYVRLKTMPCLMNTIYVHMSMVKHGTWYFKIHLPFANISWSIRIWKSCICSHISTSLLFPFFLPKKRNQSEQCWWPLVLRCWARTESWFTFVTPSKEKLISLTCENKKRNWAKFCHDSIIKNRV